MGTKVATGPLTGPHELAENLINHGLPHSTSATTTKHGTKDRARVLRWVSPAVATTPHGPHGSTLATHHGLSQTGLVLLLRLLELLLHPLCGLASHPVTLLALLLHSPKVLLLLLQLLLPLLSRTKRAIPIRD